MMTVTTNYDRRSIDIELMKTVTGVTHEIEVTPGIVDMPKKVAGLQKMIQRYAVLLLTKLGTVKFAEYQGGVLSERVATGSVSSVGDLQHLLHVASSDAIEMMSLDDADDLVYGVYPLDEQIANVDFKDISIDYNSSTAYVTAELQSKAGSELDFVLPIR